MSRDELIDTAVYAASESGRRLFGYDDTGDTYELRVNRRDAFKRDGRQSKTKGTVDVPPTCKALCLEGDDEWVQLPGWIASERWKLMESARLKSERAARPHAPPVTDH